MITSEIIRQFELQTDDTTDLSSDEELIVANRVYRKILNNRPWEFLKQAFTGTVDSSGMVDLPDDFMYVVQNANYTDSSYEAQRPVVFVGSTFSPYQIISFSDRRQYRNQNGYAYIDVAQGKLVFTGTGANGLSCEFDYIYRPDDLTLSTRPVWNEDYDDILIYGMQIEDNIIQQSDKAKSYAPENQIKYSDRMRDLAYWNSQLIQM